MVKPPINSMIVGENICEKIYLESKVGNVSKLFFSALHSLGGIGGAQSDIFTITRPDHAQDHGQERHEETGHK